MKDKKAQILKLKPWRIIKIFICAFLIFEIIFYLSFQGANDGKLWPLDNSFYYYTAALLIASVIFCYISLTQTYYTIDNTKLYHYKMGKIVDYTWNNIIYIDEEFSESKKMMLFYTKEGQEHLLAFDKNEIIYKTALEKCHLITREQFKAKFPNKKM